jgi:hypothetical protein
LAESLAPRATDVVELNLEDAFIEYTRGPRRALPIFVSDGDCPNFREAGTMTCGVGENGTVPLRP